jgi:hypothetical protein
MTHQVSSSWNIGNNGQVNASVAVNTLYEQGRKPVAIAFSCSRFVQGIDRNIYAVFVRAIRGESHLDMQVSDQCAHDNVLSGCGNRRNALSECRCEVLNRVTYPERRISYENQVINAIMSSVVAQGSPFHFRLGIFCSGELLGEEILLFRLFNVLLERGLTGTLELFFVDHCYSSAINNSTHNGSLPDAVGRSAYIEQFLLEIAQCAPQNITVKGAFFDDSEKYIQLAAQNPGFKHHLLIGADIENANIGMGKVGREAGLAVTQPIVLVKREVEGAQVCQLDSQGALENCYAPVDSGEVSSNRRNRQRNNNDDVTPLVVICVVAALLAVGVIFVGVNQSSRR